MVDGKAVGETRYNASGTVTLYMRYTFDEQGSVVGISLWYPSQGAWTDFYFAKNLQGDVVAVYRESDKALVASYSYDSWGNILSKTGNLADINPFRYRTYYFDTESWFYYLHSRFYDPAIGRFINADVFLSTGQDALGYNMFAYCNNNPVNMSDPTGESALMTLLFAATGATINVVTSYIGALVTGQSYSLTDGLVAATSGALCAFGSAGALVAGLVSGVYSAIMSYENGAEWWGALLSGLASGVFTTLGIGNLAGLEQTLSNLGIQAFVDLVFCTGTNTMSAAVYNAVTPDMPSQDMFTSSISTSIELQPATSSQAIPMGGNRSGGYSNVPSIRSVIQCCY